MIRFLGKIVIGGFSVLLLDYLLEGIEVKNFSTALLTGIVISILNQFLRPVLVFLTIPATILSLGLFLLVINALIILLVPYLVDGFSVHGFLSALIFSILYTAVNSIFESLVLPNKEKIKEEED